MECVVVRVNDAMLSFEVILKLQLLQDLRSKEAHFFLLIQFGESRGHRHQLFGRGHILHLPVFARSKISRLSIPDGP
jgi:hypothetical protein